MKNYFEEFYKRYEALKTVLEIKDINALKPEVVKSILNIESKDAIDPKNAQTLNNLVMAGLGMGTLYLRMGAVLMIAEKTKQGAETDVSFLKVIADKLIHKLPADGEWKDIWTAYLTNANTPIWKNIVDGSPSIPNYKNKIYESFVTFRNNIVHQELIINPALTDNQIVETISGLRILEAMSEFRQNFKNSIISTENNEVYFQYSSNEEKLKISPYLQINKDKTKEEIGILPYLFQGRYYKGAKFINTEGAETKEHKDEAVDDTFEKIKSDIARFNGDRAFNFNEKITNYNEWCIGRDDEVNAIMEWIKKETDKNVLPIFAPAGLGKGALVAELIKNLKSNKNKAKHLFHFCGSGAENNLQAILYSLIIQGKDGEYWNAQSLPEKFKNKLERLPSQYTDLIELFQVLLLNSKTDSKVKEVDISDLKKTIEEATNNNKKVKPLIGQYIQLVDYLITLEYHDNNELVSESLELLRTSIKILRQNNEYQDSFYPKLFDLHCKLSDNNIESDILSFIEKKHQFNSDVPKLVIIIDGLDEAAVADHSKRISDWFYTYNEKGERAEKWVSPDHIKWVFTYRDSGEKDKKGGYQFESHEFNSFTLELVQPLKGLSPEAVKNGLQIEFEKLEPALTDDFLETIIKKGAVK